MSVGSIVSTGPAIPLLFSNGSDANPSFGNDNPGNGGHITLNLSAAGLTIGSAGDLANIEANGGLFATDSIAGGNGGTIDITATGDVILNDGNITATSGAIPFGGPATLGDGGTVNITTSGAITVNSTVEVSSDDVESNPARVSAKGGKY